MAISVEELWRNSPDKELVEAVGKWPTLNDKAQRAILAEVERRGLKVTVPEIAATAAPASGGTPQAFSGKVLALMAVVFAIIGALVALV